MSAATLADNIVEHARWLEDLHATAAFDPDEMLARIDLAWRAATHARDEERETERLDTLPRISIR